MKGFFKQNKSNSRVYVEGELAIKPYYYFRNGYLHIRYNVDRVIKLSETESAKLKLEMTANPADKQSVLAKAWNFFEKTVCKPVIHDGLKEIEKNVVFNGYKN